MCLRCTAFFEYAAGWTSSASPCVGAMVSQPQRAAVTCVQPIAIVDHIARLTEDELKQVVGDETGGSRRVERDTINGMLQKAGERFAQRELCMILCCMSQGNFTGWARADKPDSEPIGTEPRLLQEPVDLTPDQADHQQTLFER